MKLRLPSWVASLGPISPIAAYSNNPFVFIRRKDSWTASVPEPLAVASSAATAAALAFFAGLGFRV